MNLDLVKVTMRTGSRTRSTCGELLRHIGRIEVETWTLDGVKVNAPPPAAHDLMIGGGYIRCFDHPPEAHQDGIQVMGGERITFRRLEIECNSEPNAQLFIAGNDGAVPTDVVCDNCLLGPGRPRRSSSPTRSDREHETPLSVRGASPRYGSIRKRATS